MSAKLYNVSLTIVELVMAESEEKAIENLRAEIRRAGFDEHEGQPPNAFESEALEKS